MEKKKIYHIGSIPSEGKYIIVLYDYNSKDIIISDRINEEGYVINIKRLFKVVNNNKKITIKETLKDNLNNILLHGFLPFIFYKEYPNKFNIELDKFINNNIDNNSFFNIDASRFYTDYNFRIANTSSFSSQRYYIDRFINNKFSGEGYFSRNNIYRTEFYIIYKRCMNKPSKHKKVIFPNTFISYYSMIDVFTFFGRLIDNRGIKVVDKRDMYNLLRDSSYIQDLDRYKDVIEFSEQHYIENGFEDINEMLGFMMTSEYSSNILYYLYYLVFKGKISIDKVIEMFKLVPHPSVSKLSYIVNFNYSRVENIVFERGSIERIEEIVSKYYEKESNYIKTDEYILNNYLKDISVYYTNMSELSRISRRFNNENDQVLFMPVKNRRCDPELDQDGLSFNDEEFYVFAIGNKHKYRCYDLDRMLGILNKKNRLYMDYYTDENNKIKYAPIENKYTNVLLKLVEYSEYPKKEEFINSLKKAIKSESNSWNIYFNKLNNSEKILLKDFFLGLFYIGMLTRRWNPDDKEYPIKENNTKHGDRGISEDTMSVILTRNYGLFKEHILDHLTKNLIKLLNKIRCMTKQGNEVQEEDINSDGKILVLLQKTFDEKDFNKVICQRIASNAFITTTDYYLRLIFEYQIPGFDISKMQTIV